MANQHIIEIILQAQDKVSQVTKKVDDQIKKIGNSGQSSFQQASQAGEKFQQKIQNTSPTIDQMQSKLKGIGASGSSSFNQLSSAEQKFIQNSVTATTATQTAANAIRNLGSSGMEAFNQLSSAEQQALVSLSTMGTTANTTANSMRTSFSTAFSNIKSKVSEVSNTIREKLSSALSTVRAKVDSLASAFSGMGGVISSALGAIGMNSVGQLTVGLAMTREQMTTLTQATMGSKTAADAFVQSMDQMTNNSLVSLNDLGAAMNTIKMSTGMTNEQLQSFSSVVNDIGQRAILMGKDSNEAMTLMQAAGRGLNGEFDILKSNFGITKEMLVDAGWSGAADDVEGYQRALEACLEKGGSMDDMMNTTTGLLKQVEKGFTSAGRQIGEMFTPYIRQALQWMTGMKQSCPQLYTALILIAGAMSGFATFAPMLAPILTAFDGMVSKGRALLVFLGLLEAEENAVTLATIRESAAQKLSAAWKAISATATKAYAVIVGVLSGEISIVSALTMAWNAILAANPIMLVVIAIIALIAAIYAVGKAFGWWDNVSQMLEAIWAGIQRIWEAFINHPEVQATIQAIQNAFQWLCDTLAPVGDFLGGIWDSIFPPDASGKVDAVAIIIEILGQAWMALTAPIRAVIEVVGFVIEMFTQLWETLQPVVEFLMGLFMPVFELIAEVLMIIFTSVLTLITAFTDFLNGQITIGEFLTVIWNTIQTMLFTILTTIVSRIITWASELLINGINAGRNFLNGVVTFISQLPGRVYTFIISTLSKIISGGAQWVSNAKSKASQVVSGVISHVSQLPGKVYTEFVNIGSKMLQAGSQLYEKAKQVGKQIVDSFLAAMQIASPGKIQRSTVKEFVDTIGRIADQVRPAGEASRKVGEAIVNSFGNGKIAKTLDVVTNINENDNWNPIGEVVQDLNSSTVLIETNHNFDGEVTLRHDFINLPDGVDAEEVANLIRETTNDEAWIKKLVSNSIFQDMDAKVKQLLERKATRARGI